jgi:hypothetical protein
MISVGQTWEEFIDDEKVSAIKVVEVKPHVVYCSVEWRNDKSNLKDKKVVRLFPYKLVHNFKLTA